MHFSAKCCQKYALDRKKLKIKVPESILYEKVSGRMSLPPARGELGRSKDGHF